MLIEVKLTSGLARLLERGPEAMRAAIRDGLNEAGMDVERAVKTATPKGATGNLQRSIRYYMASDTEMRVGSSYAAGGAPLVYAAQVEFGGPIPKSGSGRLAWPVSPQFGGVVPTPAGAAGVNVAGAMAALGVTGTFVRPSRSGRTRILFFKGAQFPKGYAPAFILASRVVQAGRHFLIPTVQGMVPRIVEQLRLAVARALEV